MKANNNQDPRFVIDCAKQTQAELISALGSAFGNQTMRVLDLGPNSFRIDCEPCFATAIKYYAVGYLHGISRQGKET